MKHSLSILTLFLVASCHIQDDIDTQAPAPPRGIRTISLDNEIELRWLANTEPDVAGYNIWQSDRYDGRYVLLSSTSGTSFSDRHAVNGVTRYYAVSAYDFSRNESELSSDVVYDTPRPEGFNVNLFCAATQPQIAGYDFSTYSIGPYNDQYTDFYFDIVQGRLVLSVWNDSDIQDMGYTSSFDDISFAPTNGWSPSGYVEAIRGHTYVIWTWDDHYAKVRVSDVTPSRVVFDWAYQTAVGNTELRVGRAVPARRPPLAISSVGAR